MKIKAISWAPYPFIRFFIAYALGIIAFVFLPIHIPYLIYIIIGLSVLFTLFKLFLKDKYFYHFTSVSGIWGFFILFLFGIYFTELNTEILNPNHFSYIKAKSFVGQINSSVHQKNGALQTEIEIKQLYADTKWIDVKGKVLVNFKNVPQEKNLIYGTSIIFNKNPLEVQNAGNPFEFDYKAYLAYHKTYHRINLSDSEFEIVNHQIGNPFLYYSYKSAHFLDSILQSNIRSKQELGIARALFLGIKDGLDNEIKQAYSSAGAMHVLAVSGMHVAILFQLLTLFLFRIPFFKNNNIATNILLLVLVWFYAFITGSSASVLRAVVMFSFTIIAKIFNKRANIYNTLAISAFVLTLYNPYLIMNVGFQLSYLAVIGIVYIYPKINSLFEPSNSIYKWIWDIICISVAAQIATFPISILYFHQFPTYFILSNLFVIPIAMLVMYSGIALLVFSFFPFLNIILGYITEKVIWLMNFGILYSEKLPFSLIEGLYISILGCILTYFIIWTAFLVFQNKKIHYLYVCLLFVSVFSAITIQRVMANSNSAIFYIYNHYSGFFGHYIENSKSVIFTNNTLSENLNTIDYISKPIKLRYNAINPIYKNIDSNANFELVIKNKKILIVNQPIEKFHLSKKYEVIYWNLNNPKQIDLSLDKLKATTLVIGANVFAKNTDKIVEICNSNNIKTHIIKNGAFHLELSN